MNICVKASDLISRKISVVLERCGKFHSFIEYSGALQQVLKGTVYNFFIITESCS